MKYQISTKNDVGRTSMHIPHAMFETSSARCAIEGGGNDGNDMVLRIIIVSLTVAATAVANDADC